MAIISRKEFAVLCKISDANLTMNIKRGKVFQNSKRKIDAKHPINLAFFQKRNPTITITAEKKLGNIKKTEKKKEQKKKIKEVKKELLVYKPTPINGIVENEQQQQTGLFGIEAEIKQAQLEKINIDIEEKKIKVAKLNGEVIPFDLVNIIFNQHSKSITTAFHNAVDNILTDFSKEFDMTIENVSKLRGSLISIINNSVKESVSISSKQIDNIVSEYSATRGVGESK